MIDELLKNIGEYILEKNPYLNKLHVNCIMLDGGQVVADYNRNEVYEGAEDITGVGAYVRYNGKYEYTKVTGASVGSKRSSSCETAHDVSVPLRLVVYNFEGPREFNQARLEEKLQNDFQNILFNGYEGQESNIDVQLEGSDTNPHSVFKSEFGDKAKQDAHYQMLAIDFKLTFVRKALKDGCLEVCDVFNNNDKC